jgi:hypothetical protein
LPWLPSLAWLQLGRLWLWRVRRRLLRKLGTVPLVLTLLWRVRLSIKKRE